LRHITLKILRHLILKVTSAIIGIKRLIFDKLLTFQFAVR